MLPLYGSRKVLCDGIPRRELLQIGAWERWGSASPMLCG